MAELTDQPTLPASTVAEATGGMPRQPGMPPDRAEPLAEPANPAGVAEELQVVAALHQVGADLGDPVEIARNSGQIVVSGTGIPPQHQKQIHEALDSMPGVVVRFQEPGTGAPSGPEAPRRIHRPSAIAPARPRRHFRRGWKSGSEDVSSSSVSVPNCSTGAKRPWPGRTPLGVWRNSFLRCERQLSIGRSPHIEESVARSPRCIRQGIRANRSRSHTPVALPWRHCGAPGFRSNRRRGSPPARNC